MVAKLPELLRIAHLEVVVLYLPMSEMESDDGWVSVRQQLIKINRDQSDVNAFETLLHEVTHVVNAIADVGDETKEEDAVRRVTPIWMQVWRDNPKLLEALNRYCGSCC